MANIKDGAMVLRGLWRNLSTLILFLFLPVSSYSFAESFAPPESSSGEPPLAHVRLQLPWHHQFEFAGFYAAIEQGFYRDEGLSLSLHERQPGISVIDEVLAGRAEFGLSNGNILARWYQGAPLTLLANLFKHSPLVVLVRQDSGIRQPSDLVGKRLMSHQPDMTSAEISYMFFKAGITLDQVSMVPHSYRVDELIRGDVDAMTAYITNQPYIIQSAGIPVRIIDPANYGADFYSNNLFTRNSLVEEYPDRVAAFHRASLKGWRYALDHPAEIVDLIYRRYSQQKSRDALHYEAREVAKLIADDIYPLGSIDPERLERLRDVYLRSGAITDTGKELPQLIWQQAKAMQGVDATPDERAFIRRYPRVRLCAYPGWLPYEGIQKKQAVGIGPDLAAILVRRLGMQMDSVLFSSWSEAVEGLEQARCDLLSAVAVSDERRHDIAFTQHYMNINNAIVTRDNQAYISDIRELSGETLAVVAGGIHEKLLFRLYPDLKLKRYLSMRTALSALSNGEVAAFVDTVATSGYAIRRSGLQNLHIAGLFPHKTQIAFGVHPSRPQLRSLLDKALLTLPEYALDSTVSHWIKVTAEPRMDYQLLWRSVAVVLLLSAVFVIYYYRLRRMNLKLAAEVEQRRQAQASARELNDVLMSQNQQLEVLSRTDVLTGLHNRYHIEKLLEDSLLNSFVYQRPLCVLLLDIDHFKQVNDHFGHPVGDQVLQQLACHLQQFCQGRYYAGRWGGEEFLVVMPATERADAKVAAETLGRQVASSSFAPVKRLTISMGLTRQRSDETVQQLLKRTDVLLYKAKASGRNQLKTDD